MQPRIRVLFVTSYPTRWLSFEWLARHLDRARFDVSFAVLDKGGSPLVRHLRACDIRVFGIPFRSMLDRRLAPLRIAQCCRAHRFDIVHAHFYGACLATLSGARLAGVRHRLYTRHYADPYDGSWERKIKAAAINGLSTRIVAPSRVVRRFLVERERVDPSKIELVHHGFHLESFRACPASEVEQVRARHGIQSSGPVIGVVSRYSVIKGLQHAIPAFRRLLRSYPSAQLVLANTRGDYAPQVRALLATLPADRYVEIPFEENIAALFASFDVFVHVPILPSVEAFGQVYIEALAAGIPSVFTASGIARECIEHDRHAWVVEHQSTDQIHDGIRTLLERPELRATLRDNGRRMVFERFGLPTMLRPLEALYERLAG